jgi:cephalosporin-C deacetylase-like acetyl esterase
LWWGKNKKNICKKQTYLSVFVRKPFSFQEKAVTLQANYMNTEETNLTSLKMLKKLILLSFIVLSMPLTLPAQQFAQEFGNPRKQFVQVVATPNHADSRYAVGQTALLRIAAQEGGVPLDGTKVYFKVGPEMFLPAGRDSVVFSDGEALIPMGTLTDPGFLACQYEFVTADGKKYSDLVKLAFSPEQIQTFTPMPKDFEQFWQKALKEARKVDLEPECFDVPDATNDQLVTKLVRLHVGKNKWIFGMLTIPRSGSLSSGEGGGRGLPVVLCPPGAGSTKVFPSDYFGREGMIYLKIEIHDNDPRIPNDEYNQMRAKKCDGYMRRGMASKDTYYYKDVYVGCARAIDFLCSLPEWDGRNVIVTGGSQGGALTIITAALNEKVTMCAPFYPALCDLTGFLHQRAGGWPKFFSGFYKDGKSDIPNEQAVETLQYFDVVNFARLLKVPTFMSWGYNDDTCSPTSVWAAWNAISSPKERDITPSSGHWRFPTSQQKCLEWMKRNLLTGEK